MNLPGVLFAWESFWRVRSVTFSHLSTFEFLLVITFQMLKKELWWLLWIEWGTDTYRIPIVGVTWATQVSMWCWAAEMKWHEMSRIKDVCLVEFVYFVFTRMLGDRYCTWFRSLLLCPLLYVWYLFSAVHSRSLLKWRGHNSLEGDYLPALFTVRCLVHEYQLFIQTRRPTAELWCCSTLASF